VSACNRRPGTELKLISPFSRRFWFAGILGMLIESKRVRRWLSTPVVVASGLEESRISHPASYSSSFNPFPGELDASG
jgi:hypothetical protein